MAANNSQDYGSLPEAVSPPKSSKRAMASVVAAVMMFAAGAAALTSKTTATAPAALIGGTAYDGSGVTWDCSAINSYVATSNGISSGTIESVGFSVTGNGQTLKNGNGSGRGRGCGEEHGSHRPSTTEANESG